MLFLGRYEHSIDAKNRLQMPAAFRKVLEAQEPELGKALIARAVIGKDPESNLRYRYIELTPEKVFAKLSAGDVMRTNVITDSRQTEQAYRIFGSSHSMDLDETGRILLTDRFTKRTASEPNPRGEKMLRGNVSIVGMGMTIQLWNANELLAYDRQKLEMALGEPLDAWDKLLDIDQKPESQG